MYYTNTRCGVYWDCMWHDATPIFYGTQTQGVVFIEIVCHTLLHRYCLGVGTIRSIYWHGALYCVLHRYRVRCLLRLYITRCHTDIVWEYNNIYLLRGCIILCYTGTGCGVYWDCMSHDATLILYVTQIHGAVFIEIVYHIMLHRYCRASLLGSALKLTLDIWPCSM